MTATLAICQIADYLNAALIAGALSAIVIIAERVVLAVIFALFGLLLAYYNGCLPARVDGAICRFLRTFSKKMNCEAAHPKKCIIYRKHS